MSYTLDSKGIIVAVSGEWDDFAHANEGEHACSSLIVGQQLDQFITGDTTRMFVWEMIYAARTLQRPIYRPYRCDSPSQKRFLEMTFQPGLNKEVEVVHRLLHCEPIAYPVTIRAAADGALSYVKRCSMCNRVQVHGLWCELDAAIATGTLSADKDGLQVNYAVCPYCQSRRGVAL